MIYQKVLLVWLQLAALSGNYVVEAGKTAKEADLGASECTGGKGKKCKLKRTQDKDIFTATGISIQFEVDGALREFEGGPRRGGKNKQPQWYGVSDGFALNLIEYDDLLFGTAHDDNFIYKISADDDGNPIVEGKAIADYPDELDDDDLTFDNFPERRTDGRRTDGEGPVEGETNNGTAFRHESMRKLGLRGRSSTSSFLNDTQRELAEVTTFDIMVVWTTNAECNNFGKSNGCTTTAATDTAMRGLIDLAVAETNVAFEESGVYVTLRLVYAYRDSAYTEDGMSNALEDVTFDNEVQAIRADVGADLVAMIIHEPTACGVAWVGPSKQRMFSVSHWGCATGYFSFGHEIGHNLGCEHDRGSKNTCNDDRTINYAYRDPDARFRSILAYNCKQNQCDNLKSDGCPRVQRFSNPDPAHAYPNPDSNPMGTDNKNNAAHINSVRVKVGAYFDEVSQCTEQSCDDGDECTRDVCEFFCRNTFDITLCPECNEDSACDDKDPCTVDTCSGNYCFNQFDPSICPEQSMTTIFDEDNGQAGNMFDIKAKNDLTIDRFHINTRNTDDVQCDVYTRVGQYEVLADDWTLLQRVTVTGQGSNIPTELPLLDQSVRVTAGTMQAFYITLTGPNQKLGYRNGNSEGDLHTENTDMQFFEGRGLPYPIDGKSFVPRIWNGKIFYNIDVDETPFPSTMPSSLSTSLPSSLSSARTVPSSEPTTSAAPSSQPSDHPSDHPSDPPSSMPIAPSSQPSDQPSDHPSDPPSSMPIDEAPFPSTMPSFGTVPSSEPSTSMAPSTQGECANVENEVNPYHAALSAAGMKFIPCEGSSDCTREGDCCATVHCMCGPYDNDEKRLLWCV